MMTVALTCGGEPVSRPAEDQAPVATMVAPATPSPATETTPMATPPAQPPPSGVAIGRDGLWVQRCDATATCPKLLQPAGLKHCDALELGGHDDWRLPTRAEVNGLGRLDGLEDRAGYHFTATVDDGNEALVWIVDPTTNQPTTVPPTRKPFTIRCVRGDA